MSVVIKVEQLSKAYQLGEIGTGTISRDLERWFAKIRGKEDPFLKVGEVNDRAARGDSDIVWSLRDINFDILQGESVGVIGRNGAGKSTLLKLLSRVTAPTTGQIKVKGRIASLLEVGTGFHPELTGKENVYLNGAILGMRKKEIDRKFDEIVDFSGVERYIETPVKRYSSGMYVRLAFAVAAYLESEILIVDEVLAVGDAEFQQKCLGKMKDVSTRQGRTVLFVSHNMSAVLNLCNKGVVLRNGLLDYCGNLREAVQLYQNSNMSRSNEWIADKAATLPQIRYAWLDLAEEQPNLTLKIKVKIGSASNNSPAFIAFDIKNGFGTTIMQAIPSITPFLECNGNEKEYEFQVDLVGLIPDSYYVSIWIGPHNSETYDWQKDILSFEVQQSPTAGRTFPHHYDNGFIVPNSKIIQGL
ncbi:MAG TPA: ABC transporter ATP-binding protein [Puia sp.]|jgi:lipopolysaccharide transport system ATP-binding protein|nr:ABC transporter ATP-binding protein [Puia sp.]